MYLPQGIFQTPGWNVCVLHLLHWQECSLSAETQWKPKCHTLPLKAIWNFKGEIVTKNKPRWFQNVSSSYICPLCPDFGLHLSDLEAFHQDLCWVVETERVAISAHQPRAVFINTKEKRKRQHFILEIISSLLSDLCYRSSLILYSKHIILLVA